MIDGVRLSEAIARHKEPAPTWSEWMYDGEPAYQKSDGGWWLGHRDDPSDEDEKIEQTARRHANPEISMLLLKELLAMPDWQVNIGDSWKDGAKVVEFEVVPTEDGYKRGLRGFIQQWPIEQIADGIAISYAKAVGLDVEG